MRLRLTTFARREGRLPIGLVGMAALVLLIEWGLAARDQRLATSWSEDWREAGRVAARKASDRQVLCFGDSQIKSAVLPTVIEDLAGLRSYNLAVGAGSPVGSYFLLRRAIDAGARPEAVVLGAIPHILSDADGWYHRRLWPEMLGLRDLIDLSWTSRDSDLLASLLVGRFVPSYRGRHEARSRVLVALSGGHDTERLAIATSARNRRVNQGASVMPVDPAFGAQEDLSAALYPDRWGCRRLNRIYLERFLSLAERHGVTVHWVIMPFRPEVEARRGAMGLTARYTRFLRGLLADHPGVVVHDARGSGYGAEHFVDPIHLNVQGATALSADLAHALRRGQDVASAASGPIWDALPRPAEPVLGRSIEDVAQSMNRVQQWGVARR